MGSTVSCCASYRLLMKPFTLLIPSNARNFTFLVKTKTLLKISKTQQVLVQNSFIFLQLRHKIHDAPQVRTFYGYWKAKKTTEPLG